MKKGVISSNLTVHSDGGRAWDSGAAIKRIKEWASDDDGKIDFSKYSKAFFWVETEAGDQQSDYKLPYADVVDGDLVAVKNGVSAAMGAVMDNRTDAGLTDGDRKSLHEAIGEYYKKFSMELPEITKSVTPNEEEDTEIEGDEDTPDLNLKAGDALFASAEFVERAADDGSFTAVASTSAEDRHGEVVDIGGWNIKNFKKNPVLLWAHDHSIPAIGKATRIWVSDGKLMFKGIWQDVTEMGRAAKALVEKGIVNSFSVGFLPFEMDGNTYTKQELLEISLVNVPANPDAQMLAYKSLRKAGFKKNVIKEMGIPVEVLDKFESMEKNITELTDKVESLAKAQKRSVAPKVHEKTNRAKQSLTKVIAKASDQLLAGEKTDLGKQERVKLLKVVKRAAEILSKAQKEHING